MAQHWFCLYVQRIDATKNMARYYTMSIEPNLFGGASIVRRWGRIGTRGKECVVLFKNERHAIECFLVLARQKRARGYRPRPRSDL
ncbi:WGR domain-containing protein [Sinorhizobium meliloti]|uniref:WGR domain-containing protein n=1 Tax=Rhizobium meliloti TaxID=382 RepID=UPI000FDB1C14|nr:WGR domain-containing protein [Sinorhizobium meliloti]MDW9683199.1 WGR domain-containing protein [Sinorhizobium meliloti]MDW9695588.1 WGR domain-containing protein [Sinorhizobium meliloti]MDW9720475.1 WGR domain-containing protein [Sinorhizobium meliloti]MDW9757696.1 WGR domain-containing protein [Sinorhizobium meliloti]MDW9986577.1 WGR domain-containing protein [Sinorhizobium meliloti]